MNRIALLAAAAATFLMSGCSTKYQSLTPELQAGMMTDLQAGKMNLDCHEGCLLTWIGQAASIHQLDLAEKWNDLAVRVMQIGYGSDLAYYYLGQSAQGLGYHQAAIAYYSTSLSLATGMNPLLKCSAGQGNGADPCQGVDIVSSIPVLIQASRDVIAQQEADASAAADATPAPVHHHHRHKTATASSGSGSAGGTSAAASTGGSNWVAPPPPSSGQSSAGWVAPPPPAQ